MSYPQKHIEFIDKKRINGGSQQVEQDELEIKIPLKFIQRSNYADLSNRISERQSKLLAKKNSDDEDEEGSCDMSDELNKTPIRRTDFNEIREQSILSRLLFKNEKEESAVGNFNQKKKENHTPLSSQEIQKIAQDNKREALLMAREQPGIRYECPIEPCKGTANSLRLLVLHFQEHHRGFYDENFNEGYVPGVRQDQLTALGVSAMELSSSSYSLTQMIDQDNQYPEGVFDREDEDDFY